VRIDDGAEFDCQPGADADGFDPVASPPHPASPLPWGAERRVEATPRVSSPPLWGGEAG
jgi:hypothetical protein